MPSVLLVTQDLERAGAQRQCVELALGLRSRPGWRVEVATLEPDGPLGEELRAAGVPLHECPRRWRWDLGPVGLIAAIARDGHFDVVHGFLFLPNFYTRLARLRYRPRVTISSLRSTGIEGLPRYVAEVLLAPLCDRIIANSEAGRQDLISRGVRADRIVVVRNGLALDRFLALAPPPSPPRRQPVLGMVAQMEPRKDHEGLVRAFAAVVRRHPGARLVLAGDGRLRPRIEALVQSLDLGAQVELAGTVPASERVYDRLDLYVQSSASQEGTSNSIVEAMAAARPVVATDIGGNAETVADGETGLIVPPGDAGALAEAIERLLGDPVLHQRLSLAARRRAIERYSRERMIEETIRQYTSLLGAGADDATSQPPVTTS